ncbi:hypothetical protein Desde_0876 [Desulfitobacterium dehalogenans ATCC 51507]|uniref:Lipoprotein n=1 Tax=Desulfitobacterium dehalogenans (strain ATCC 51507 / DSM 9161 / JW/IU-DC1) TaxID=756499 RepID=I4A5T2_DESDJ|nr:hypothetical protein [Desulfitobacterium dehalogenans]AFL99316.1 hypothetical protein Desde_0876 [Desulfitobacterium dehalogenans ATCC 51507]
MKRTIFFVLVVSLLLACTTSYFANIKISAHQIYKTEIMEQREGYEKVKITNLETGKVEYLESILDDDGLYMYLATSEEGSFEIKLMVLLSGRQIWILTKQHYQKSKVLKWKREI